MKPHGSKTQFDWDAFSKEFYYLIKSHDSKTGHPDVQKNRAIHTHNPITQITDIRK